MRTLLALAATLASLHTPAQPGVDTHGISLELIMSDPEWIGRFPQNARWSAEGTRIVFERNRPGSVLTDAFEIDPATGAERPLTDAERALSGRVRWAFDADRTRRVGSLGGDLWIGEGATGSLRQLTRTSASEGSAGFLTDGRVRSESGGQWYALDLATSALTQLADVRFEDEPKPDEDDDEDYLDRQQERLFTTIAKRQQRALDLAEQRRAIERADPSAVPGPFFLGKGLQRRAWALSDDARYLALVVAKPSPEAKRDVMPSYVTEDGYASTSPVRPKVGVGEQAPEKLLILDLAGETWAEADLSALPGLTDDPLAFLRKEGGPESSGDEPELGPEPHTEPAPRPVEIRALAWRPGAEGPVLVAQAWSHDHKDRWVFALRPGEKPEAEPVFRDTTEAWVNRRTQQGAWTTDGSAYWFLSEAPGFAHIHAWDGVAVRQITSGSFEVWDAQEGAEPGVLYARTNQPDPSITELARVTLADARMELLTNLGAVVERFELSAGGSRALLEVSRLWHAPELFVLPLDGAPGPTRLTHSVSGRFAEIPWIEPEFVDVPCRDQRSVRARVYDFRSGGPDSPRPGVIFVHGAGYTQNVDRGWPYYFREMMFHSLLAYKGYVVVDLDFRASAGYGRDFRTAIYRQMGTPELEDMVDAARWMTSERGVDPARIGAYGGSYGGFLAIMALFKEPEIFAAGAALRPVTDWAHYNQGYTSEILNTPDVDPGAYERSSPIEFAGGFRGGLLICHGVLDDNVLVQDTVRLQQRLIELGKEDWEVALYPLEAHGFEDPAAWLDEYRRILALFDRRLRTPGAPPEKGR